MSKPGVGSNEVEKERLEAKPATAKECYRRKGDTASLQEMAGRFSARNRISPTPFRLRKRSGPAKARPGRSRRQNPCF